MPNDKNPVILLGALRLGSNITDKGMPHVTCLTGLKSLHINETSITDRGLEKIADLVNLEYIVLSPGQVSQVSIQQLKNLPKLTKVGCYVESLKDAAYLLLKVSLPKVEIEC